MYRLLNTLLLLLVCITQSGIDVAAAVTSDGHLVERTPGKRIQIRPGKGESSFFKLQNSQSKSEFNPLTNPEIAFSPAIAASSVTPSKTTPGVNDEDSSAHEKREDSSGEIIGRLLPRTCPAHPLPSGRCHCSGQTFCNSGSGSSCAFLNTSHENCGACHHRCGGDQTCKSGNCICKRTGLSVCGSSCVDLSNNEENCGRCGHHCPQGRTCVTRRCVKL